MSTEDDLRQRAKAIAAEANECCNRSDGYEEAIEDLALQHLANAVASERAEIDRLRAALKKIADDAFVPEDWDGKGQAWTNVAQRALEQYVSKGES